MIILDLHGASVIILIDSNHKYSSYEQQWNNGRRLSSSENTTQVTNIKNQVTNIKKQVQTIRVINNGDSAYSKYHSKYHALG